MGTPIGNLDDLSPRALAALRQAEFIAAEDTRHTGKLLRHFGIATTVVSLHQHNEVKRLARLVDRLVAGETGALVTDAGMPTISDPGALFVAAAREAGVSVVVVPGPAAVTTALAGSGANADRFVFEGFLPRSGTERKLRLQAIAADERTTVLYEAPHRLVRTLQDLAEYVPARLITVARELTKVHEEFRSGTAAELSEHYAAAGVRGECTLVIHAGEAVAHQPESAATPSDGQPVWLADALALVAAGESHKDSARTVAAKYGIARRDVYQALLAAVRDAAEQI